MLPFHGYFRVQVDLFKDPVWYGDAGIGLNTVHFFNEASRYFPRR